MTDNLLARDFYQNEAVLSWQNLKDSLPEALHVDLVSDGTELRVFLAVGIGNNPTLEFINFGLTEDFEPIDAAYILRNYDHADFCKLSDEELTFVWNKYECKQFLASGANADADKTDSYNILMNTKTR